MTIITGYEECITRVTVIERKTCDICHKATGYDNKYFTHEGEWKSITISCETYHDYPGPDVYEWDVCPECFEKHIKPLLKNRGRWER